MVRLGDRLAEKRTKRLGWLESHRGWSYQYVPRVNRENVHGDPGPLDMSCITGRLSIKKPGLAEVPPISLVHPDRSVHVKPVSVEQLAHRSAAHVQQVFNEAGWSIAVWYGNHTKTYWVMDESGLHEFDTITAMYQGMGWEAL